MGMKFAEAKAKALEAGASEADIAKEAKAVKRGSYGGGVFKRNMVMALQMHSFRNSAAEWARLAGALMPAGQVAKLV
jgi:hypothetical protein